MGVTIFNSKECAYLVVSKRRFDSADLDKLSWLLQAEVVPCDSLPGPFVGPRREMVSPWSTNAVDIAKRVGIDSLIRIEAYRSATATTELDPMLEERVDVLTQETLNVLGAPQASFAVDSIADFNQVEGLALSAEEIAYLEAQAKKRGYPFNDAEIYAFAQINSEHCRHKIFNGSFIIDGKEQSESLFSLIKATSKAAPNEVVSAYKDNVAFLRGAPANQFAPTSLEAGAKYGFSSTDTIVSLKAETHNFPTTVEPLYGASTGSGGEIRDRMAGGRGSIPLAGSAVYMTSYPRSGAAPRSYEEALPARKWKFQSPAKILTKASNGASDFGNKFGQPLVCGSVLTFEAQLNGELHAYDRAVMLAGGVGTAKKEHAEKQAAQVGDKLVLLGGDNYRIGMGGGAVSSVDSGAVSSQLELSAIQRANPEMQKRVFNVIRTLVEVGENPIRLIHDHGAGGHINCFSELLEPLGGEVQLDALPIGDPTLSVREIICNESQERMGLIVSAKDLSLLERIAKREQAPLYIVGEVTGNNTVVFKDSSGEAQVSLSMETLFGSTPKTELTDSTVELSYSELPQLTTDQFFSSLSQVLSLEGVGCKDWLTNKVDRSVTGRIAQQQTVGSRQLPLSNFAITTFDYTGSSGMASSLGHASIAGLLDARAGARLSVAEALTNMMFVPLRGGLESISLSANWMWPAKQERENARLYHAVEALSEFCFSLGIAVPTGKDSLSMTMNYPDGSKVKAPGTVIVSAVAVTDDPRGRVLPVLSTKSGTLLIYLDLSGDTAFSLGGSAFEQVSATLAARPADVAQVSSLKAGFSLVQDWIRAGKVHAGHDVSYGGIITSVLEMAFAGESGLALEWPHAAEELFCEKPAVVLQVDDGDGCIEQARDAGLECFKIGTITEAQTVSLHVGGEALEIQLGELFESWLEPSLNMEKRQVSDALAEERAQVLRKHSQRYRFPEGFDGTAASVGANLVRTGGAAAQAAIVRDKGTNGEREMAYALHAAGFEVLDIAMEDLLSGTCDFSNVSFVIFTGGFSNSDVLGAARGWAAAFRYNDRAYKALTDFYAREDTLSLGVCNGCQLMGLLNLICPEHEVSPLLLENTSRKFESTFLEVDIEETNSILLKPLIGSRLGIWVAHGEGRFLLPKEEAAYDIPMRYIEDTYPLNPNGSDYRAAAVSSTDGRHLVMMPHLERSLTPWQCGNYPQERFRSDEVSPWMLVFTAARDWVKNW